MAKTVAFEKGSITPKQAYLVASAIGAIVGRLTQKGSLDTLKGNPETTALLEAVIQMIDSLSTDTDESYSELISRYNCHATMNYLSATVGAGPGIDTELLVRNPDEAGN